VPQRCEHSFEPGGEEAVAVYAQRAVFSHNSIS